MDGVPRIRLSAGGYSAVISEVGAAVRSLRHGDRELVLDGGAALPAPPFAGAILAPWPNRIADGRYTFDGQVQQLAINDVPHRAALHGLALYATWERVRANGRSVVLRHIVRPQPGYPFAIELLARFELDDAGLHTTLTATNIGCGPAPVGLSSHLHLQTGTGSPVDDWTLELPCHDVLVVDDRLLPVRVEAVAGSELDFTTPRRLGPTVVDHAFTSTDAGPSGRSAATLRDAAGCGVQMTWTSACPWLQVYTVDSDDPGLHRRGVAIEPMTCAPNAFNDLDQPVLDAGAQRSIDWSVGALVGP